MLSKILVTLDGSKLAELALPYAEKVVSPTGELVLLSVVDVPDFPIYAAYPMAVPSPKTDYTTIVNDMIDVAKDYLDEVANRLRLSGLRVKTVVKIGEPASGIIEEAKELNVDAVVMSTHGRSGLSRWLFGSITQKVLNVMPCPVIVVPGKTEAIVNSDAEESEVPTV